MLATREAHVAVGDLFGGRFVIDPVPRRDRRAHGGHCTRCVVRELDTKAPGAVGLVHLTTMDGDPSAMGGEMTLQSEPGRGSTAVLEITLRAISDIQSEVPPIADESRARPRARARSINTSNPANKRLLIAEDEDSLRALVARGLGAVDRERLALGASAGADGAAPPPPEKKWTAAEDPGPKGPGWVVQIKGHHYHNELFRFHNYPKRVLDRRESRKITCPRSLYPKRSTSPILV